jgi:hypothetical protein
MSKKSAYNTTCEVPIRLSNVINHAKSRGLLLNKLDAAYLCGFISEFVEHILGKVKENKEAEKTKVKSFSPEDIEKVLRSSRSLRSINSCLSLRMNSKQIDAPVSIPKVAPQKRKRKRKEPVRKTRKEKPKMKAKRKRK